MENQFGLTEMSVYSKKKLILLIVIKFNSLVLIYLISNHRK